MRFTQAVSMGFVKYFDFKGRASRSEYWWFTLFIYAAIVLALLVAMETLAAVVWLATFVPHLAVTVRRLHDHNRSGWFFLVSVIPVFGTVMLLLWLVTESDSTYPNRYGESPLRPVI